MKKLFALILAALMVLGCAAVASAEQVETLELNWEDFAKEIESSEEAKAAWAGDFVTMDEIALKLYIPASFEQVELADEVRASGLLKDRIVITYPDSVNNDMAVLQAATDEWKNKWEHWAEYR